MKQDSSCPLISVVIPHYNGIEILDACLESLQRCDYPNLEIIVVDNASTDGSPEHIKKKYSEIRLIENKENRGFAGGCNEGIKAARGDFVCILNNDTTHEPDWLRFLADTLLKDKNIAAVQPKILSHQNREYFDYSGAAGGLIDIFGYPFARGRIFETTEKDNGQYNDPSEIFWASGTAFLTRKELLLKAGGFDESFFAHMEEIDLQWKFHLMGYKVLANPSAVVYHHSGYTLGAESPLKKYLNHRNNLLMLLSNYGIPTLLYLFPLRLVLEMATLFFSLATLDTGRFFAIPRAIAWILIHPQVILMKRRTVKRVRKIRDLELMKKMYHGSIALNYYLLRQRLSPLHRSAV